MPEEVETPESFEKSVGPPGDREAEVSVPDEYPETPTEDEDYDLEEEEEPEGDLEPQEPQVPPDSPPMEREPEADAAPQLAQRLSTMENAMNQMAHTFNQLLQHQAAQRQSQSYPTATPPPDPGQLDEMDNSQLVQTALTQADQRMANYLNQANQTMTQRLRTQGDLFANMLESLFAGKPEFETAMRHVNQAAGMWLRNPREKFGNYVALVKSQELQTNNQKLQKQVQDGKKTTRKRADKARRGSKAARQARQTARTDKELSRQDAIRAAMKEVG